mgnify:CR=1 FL=1
MVISLMMNSPKMRLMRLTDVWLLSHLMDDTSSFASDKSSHKSFKKSTADDVEDPGGIFYNANEMDEEVDLNFVVDDDVGPMVEDAGEAAEQSLLFLAAAVLLQKLRIKFTTRVSKQ